MFNLNSIKMNFLSGGVEEASYRQIREKMHESNRRTLLIFSYVAGGAFFVLLAASFLVSAVGTYRTVYVIGFLLSALIWAIAQYPGKKSRTAVIADMYVFDFLLLSVGIAMGTVLGPDELAATFIALLLAVPQLFTDRPWRMHVLTLVSVILFIGMVLRFKNPVTVSSDIINAVMFGILSIALSTFSIINRIRRYALEYEISYLAENDQLTGLKNRYCYQKYLGETDILKSKSIYCVYIDANGLHELNDAQGHEAGDRMLQFIATVMQNLFGKDCTYRIGGDEFVALGEDKTTAEVERLVSEMKTSLDTAGYHVAAGIGRREKVEIDIGTLIRNAEEMMYKDKELYYKKTGNSRQSR